MDCSLAAVNDPTLGYQNIGRFVPLSATEQYVVKIQAGTTGLPDYYAWTSNLFNYLTVQSPSDTYLPNYDPNLRSSDYTGATVFAYPPQNPTSPNPIISPTPTMTADQSAPDSTKQDTIGVDGLININTASWKVLSMLPFVPNNGAANRAIAQSIVQWRLAHGPFKSIFDLNSVPNFQTGGGTFDPTKPASGTLHPSSALGLLTPFDTGFGSASPNPNPPLGPEEDYQDDCLTLTRISNLITTRSDTFTVYIEIQGWQNAGSTVATLPPQPVITRRYAFIVDRSGVNADPSSRYLKTLTVPND